MKYRRKQELKHAIKILLNAEKSAIKELPDVLRTEAEKIRRLDG